jgi:ferredoxin
MGCLVGQENKKKTHQSLAANILNINRKVKPHLHIVDAVISMEGLGPTRGTPVQTGMILIGTDPYLIDLMCARISSFDYRRVRTLAEAEKREIIHSEYHRFVKDFPLQNIFRFKPPHPGPMAQFIHNPKRQKYFLAVRNTPLFNYFCSTQIGGKMMYLLGLRQDVFIPDEIECERLEFNTSRCSRCAKCADYCPIGLDLPDALSSKNDKCIYCLYCFCVCPEQAIEFKGKLGFMGEQLKQYDAIVRKIA